jgi:hypothetical protein
MRYEKFTVTDPFTKKVTEYISAYVEDGFAETFLVDENNLRYQQYLEDTGSVHVTPKK